MALAVLARPHHSGSFIVNKITKYIFMTILSGFIINENIGSNQDIAANVVYQLLGLLLTRCH